MPYVYPFQFCASAKRPNLPYMGGLTFSIYKVASSLYGRLYLPYMEDFAPSEPTQLRLAYGKLNIKLKNTMRS